MDFQSGIFASDFGVLIPAEEMGRNALPDELFTVFIRILRKKFYNTFYSFKIFILFGKKYSWKNRFNVKLRGQMLAGYMYYRYFHILLSYVR